MILESVTVECLSRLARTRDQLRAGQEVMRRQVIEARGAGASWESIGRMVGTTGEAARQKYSPRLARKTADQGDLLF